MAVLPLESEARTVKFDAPGVMGGVPYRLPPPPASAGAGLSRERAGMLTENVWTRPRRR